MLLIEACHGNNKKPVCPRVRYPEGNLTTRVPTMGLEFDGQGSGVCGQPAQKARQSRAYQVRVYSQRQSPTCFPQLGNKVKVN